MFQEIFRGSRRWWHRLRTAGADRGMATAEYALGTVASCALAAVLYKVVTSGTVAGLLQGALEKAFHVRL
ncbi:hypothetical protein B1H19_23050 [Streptomyces gilvosporeus]|uniref:DUF4244 domain-containing protein n=1 Tax=Streptomyces gilvosporeus TaxID=553510 RepID=A0A1V0TUU3_9ACTN|nr:DUF4244 domain-containing protein [Streptomyces gilvosporeus]ARF56661.1 hypothetical protein B1H19_23050 [Streptomyces gilvosporeus]